LKVFSVPDSQIVSGIEIRVVRWMCDIKVKDRVPSKVLSERG